MSQHAVLMVSCLRQVLSLRGRCAHTSIPRAPGQNDGIHALHRPSSVDTCFVMSSALSPLVQTSAGLSLPGVFAHCTASRAFKHCTNRKPQSTCLGLPRLWRCVTPKGVLASLRWTVLHACTRSRITDLEPHCLGACLHQRVQLRLSRTWRNERLRFAPALDVAPVYENPATGAPSVRRVSGPSVHRCRPSASLSRPGTCTRTQPRTASQASSYSFQCGPVKHGRSRHRSAAFLGSEWQVN